MPNLFPSIPEKILKTDVLSSDSSFKLRDVTWYTGSDGVDVDLTSSDFGGIGYGVFEPRTASQEFFTWDTTTIGNATTTGITILSRGLIPGSNYTDSSSARKFFHGTGSKVLLFTNAPALYNTFANKANSETITGAWTYSTTPVISNVPTAGTQAANKTYVDSVAVAGAPNADTSTKGIVEIATGAELAAGTGTGGTGAAVVPAGSSFKNTSAGAGDANKVPVLNSSGVLDSTFIPPSIPDQAIFGDGSDGDVTLSGNTTLARDMFYNNLTIPSTYTLDTAGYRVFVKGTLTRSGTGKIFNNGTAGSNGSAGSGSTGGTGGAAGISAPGVTVPGSPQPGAGGAGAGRSSSGTTAGTAGSNGTAVTSTFAAANTTTPGAGGDGSGSAGTGAGGAAGSSGASTAVKTAIRTAISAINLSFPGGSSVTLIRPAGSNGGGGGGGVSTNGSSNVAGGGGGGGGGNGGVVWVAAKTIVDSGSGTMFESIGGAGGNGGNGAVAGTNNEGAGGGGAGPGGHGGFIIRLYKTLTGTAATSVVAGANGSAGTGASNGGGTGSNGAAVGTSPSNGATYDVVIPLYGS